MNNILGISAGFHDAAATVISPQGEILFAGHSERYSKYKHDANISYGLIEDIRNHGGDIDTVAYYEKPWKKQLRSVRAGQKFSWQNLTTRQCIHNQIGPSRSWPKLKYRSYDHHRSHAAAGFQTSPFDRATVVVIDAIGEFETISIWGAEYDCQGRAQYRKLWHQLYPHSIGLFYSAMTQRVGLHPMDEEYITMGMSAYGNSNNWFQHISEQLIKDYHTVEFRENLHLGLGADFLPGASNEDLAAAAQLTVETLIQSVMMRAKKYNWSSNLVYMGGVALNCLANRTLGNYFDRIWIMPAPGDAGSSLGAAALALGKQIHWTNAYLGHNIAGDYPVDSVVRELLDNKIVGVASGRAEFGPRALGHRSLLADPRGPDIKDRVNEIKRRQKFRPFAPVILEEFADEYFRMPKTWVDSRYMQIVAPCRRPDLFPAIVHVDGTSRVQTVPRDGTGIRKLLESWYQRTGCPMLLNTSLNVRGEPMVNDRTDADRFEVLYGVKVCS